MPNVIVRAAEAEDSRTFLRLIEALAEYESLTPPDADAQERLLRDAFGEKRRIEAWLVEVDGVAAGYAIVFETYSSFLALPTLYLEDIFVLPSYRGCGAGKALFLALARLARERNCGRMEWTVLDWNRLALDFYERLGARHMREWLLYRLTAEDLAALGE
ncbi:MAG: GNAT family N-acetyltransferase [Ignavibacteriae bacterium]|nr:GNAT family N-acetyltransferase [Ignavibacteriota bacterium]